MAEEQGVLLELEGQARPAEGKREARLRRPERAQLVMDTIDLERMIAPGHLARAVWELAGMLPTEGFLAENKSVEGHAGRPRLCPKMMLSLWVYGYSQGLGEGHAIAEEMKYEPGLRWLAGNDLICGRSLCEFRVAHAQALEQVFAELLGILARDGLVNLHELTLDGTKIKAHASSSSRRREKTLREHVAEAAEAVRTLENPHDAAERSAKKLEAQRRGAAERSRRLQAGLEELQKIRGGKPASQQEQARVSETDPQARPMKNGEGAYILGYNVQLATETKNKIIVNVAATQDAADQKQWEPALHRLAHQPVTVIVDGGYVTHDNLVAASARNVEMIGPAMDIDARIERGRQASLRSAGIAPEFGPQAFVQIENGAAVRCPAGQRLPLQGVFDGYQRYRSKSSDCAACAHRQLCSPQGRRTVKLRCGADERRQIEREFAERMRSEANREQYKKRGPTAEFPHAWIKEKFGLRQFHVRGLVKVGLEALWVALAYNIRQWERLVWRPKLQPAAM